MIKRFSDSERECAPDEQTREANGASRTFAFLNSLNPTRVIERASEWVVDWKAARWQRQFETNTEAVLHVETLETRMMLSGSGDGSDPVEEPVPVSLFDLPPIVGETLVNALTDSGKLGAGPWQADVSTDATIGWTDLNRVEAAEDNSWRDYLIDDVAPTGSSTDYVIDSSDYDGGGHLILLKEVELDRSVVGQDTSSGGASAGGAGDQGETVAPIKVEMISATVTTTYVWTQDQSEVNDALASGSFNKDDFGSYFQFTIENDWTFEDFETTGNEVRSFAVSNDFLISVSYAWSGSASTVSPEGEGTSTTSIGFNTSGSLTFEGENRYVGKTFVDSNTGYVIEDYELDGTGELAIWLSSNNSVSSDYVEGDLDGGSGFGTNITISVVDDYLYSSETVYLYDGDGERKISNDDGDEYFHFRSDSSYTFQSSPVVTTSYGTRQDLTVGVNQDLIDSANEEGDGSGDRDDSPEVHQFSSVIFSASGGSTTNSVFGGNGYGHVELTKTDLYGGVSTSNLTGASYDYWDTTGSNSSSDGESKLVYESPGEFVSDSATVDLQLEGDNTGFAYGTFSFVNTVNDLDPDDEGDLLGYADTDTTILSSRSKVDLETTFDQRAAYSATIPVDDEVEGNWATTAGGVAYVTDLAATALDPEGAENNPEIPHNEEGFNIFYSVAAGKSSSVYEETLQGEGESDVRIEFLTGDASSLTTEGNHQTSFTSSGESRLSGDTQFTSGVYSEDSNGVASGNGNFASLHFSADNTSASHGDFGDTYNLNWLFEEGAFTEVPSEGDGSDGNGDDNSEGTTAIEVDFEKITLTGNSTSNGSSTIDTDVTNTLEKTRTGGYYFEGVKNSDGSIDESQSYELNWWNGDSHFAETTTGSGGGSVVSNGEYSAALLEDAIDASSNYSSDTTGNGNTTGSYVHHKVVFGGQMSELNGNSEEGGDANSGLGTFERHEEFLSFTSSSDLGSDGIALTDFAQNTTSSIIKHGVDDSGGGTDGGTGGAGEPDPPPSYDVQFDEITTLSNAGATTMNNSSSYGLDVNSPSFQFDYLSVTTGIAGHEDNLVETKTESHISSENNAPHTDLAVSNDVEQKFEWREDGLYLVSNGSMATTLSSSGETKNHGVIEEYRKYEFGTDPELSTREITNAIAPEDYRVTYSDTTTITDSYEDFGQKVIYSVIEQDPENEDPQLALGPQIEMDANGVGKHTRTINSVGDETFDLTRSRYNSISTPTGGGFRSDTLIIDSDGNWSLIDEIAGDFEAGGSYSITYAPGGMRQKTTIAKTEGEHHYVYNRPADDGFHETWVQRGVLETTPDNPSNDSFKAYESITTFDTTLNRNINEEQVFANYASDGTLVAASGSITNKIAHKGDAFADEGTLVKKTKSKTTEYDTSGGDAGSGPGGPGGPLLASSTEEYIAWRHHTIDSEDHFDSETLVTYNAQIEGDGTLGFSDPTTTTSNDVWGDFVETDSSFVRHDTTNVYTDGSQSTSSNYLHDNSNPAPHIEQYGSQQSPLNLTYDGFYQDDFNSYLFTADTIDIAYEGGVATFAPSDGNFGVENGSENWSFLQEYDGGTEGDDPGGNPFFNWIKAGLTIAATPLSNANKKHGFTEGLESASDILEHTDRAGWSHMATDFAGKNANHVFGTADALAEGNYDEAADRQFGWIIGSLTNSSLFDPQGDFDDFVSGLIISSSSDLSDDQKAFLINLREELKKHDGRPPTEIRAAIEQLVQEKGPAFQESLEAGEADSFIVELVVLEAATAGIAPALELRVLSETGEFIAKRTIVPKNGVIRTAVEGGDAAGDAARLLPDGFTIDDIPKAIDGVTDRSTEIAAKIKNGDIVLIIADDYQHLLRLHKQFARKYPDELIDGFQYGRFAVVNRESSKILGRVVHEGNHVIDEVYEGLGHLSRYKLEVRSEIAEFLFNDVLGLSQRKKTLWDVLEWVGKHFIGKK